uniref:Uncharacterized protein n=1 Tax=Romanomermis culicivorax TaxID=13658 RepID=A0A915IRB0_ROMCU
MRLREKKRRKKGGIKGAKAKEEGTNLCIVLRAGKNSNVIRAYITYSPTKMDEVQGLASPYSFSLSFSWPLCPVPEASASPDATEFVASIFCLCTATVDDGTDGQPSKSIIFMVVTRIFQSIPSNLIISLSIKRCFLNKSKSISTTKPSLK